MPKDEAEPLSALDSDPRPNEAPVFAGVDGSQLSRFGLRSALLGSTPRSLLHQMAGPVMVVPQLADDRVEDPPETR